MIDPLRSALRISWVTIGWSAVTGTLSVAFGLAAASLALVGSGVSVIVDLSSSLVLVWRFRHPHGYGAIEQRAQRFATAALMTLAALLGVSSVYRLVGGGEAHPTGDSIAVAIAAVVTLPVLAARKYVVARRVPSRALTTDAHITMVGATTALLTLVGLAFTDAGYGSADSLAALAVAIMAAFVGFKELPNGGLS